MPNITLKLIITICRPTSEQFLLQIYSLTSQYTPAYTPFATQRPSTPIFTMIMIPIIKEGFTQGMNATMLSRIDRRTLKELKSMISRKAMLKTRCSSAIKKVAQMTREILDTSFSLLCPKMCRCLLVVCSQLDRVTMKIERKVVRLKMPLVTSRMSLTMIPKIPNRTVNAQPVVCVFMLLKKLGFSCSKIFTPVHRFSSNS